MMGGHLAIRTRIAGGSLIIAVLMSIVAGIILNSQIERIVREGTVAVLESESAPYVVALSTEPSEPFDSPGPTQHVAVVAPDGSTPLNTLPHSISARLPSLTQHPGATAVHVGTAEFIVLVTPVELNGETWHVVAASSDVQEVTVLGQMRMLLIVGLAVISLGVGVTAWLLTSASLAPVQQLRLSAQKLSAADSGELLPVGTANDEISHLAATLNELITRLRASASRERQLVADASHELRTPIAILTTQLQLAADTSAPVEQLVEDIEGARRNVARLSTLVTSLLELSSYEAASARGTSTAAELEGEAIDAVERAAFRAADSGIHVSFLGPSGSRQGAAEDSNAARFPIRAEDFGRVLDNLCSNSLQAMKASDAPLSPRLLEVRMLQSGEARDTVTFTVSDTGGGLAPDFEARAFERFSREDESRAHGGAGLGLAIVAAIVTNAGGEVELSNHFGTGVDVSITLRALRQDDSPSR
ncbi:signal transduction histidine kinase [Microterricola gilva]|uniref:histidine kinase n=1 Tax=Microterricola gilva TaxID=393267 RepID=A0A4V2GB41_9MICO|nr:HAMP domain-containing sensor histidine kinase [Microterricola gilva]RZU66726.1 signal transduction histidine kinase [Microterricola gilva]